MAYPPSRPLEIKRSNEPQDATVASPLLVRRRDRRQRELFATSFVAHGEPVRST
jgi:hypothetical protein